MSAKETLYQRIGGDSAVSATVLKMYDKILDDELLAPFFQDIDIDALRRSQQAFVTFAFGGPANYHGKNLRTAHQHAVDGGLKDQHFDRVALHLKDAMVELNVAQNLIDEALAIVGSTRNEVLNK